MNLKIIINKIQNFIIDRLIEISGFIIIIIGGVT